MVKRLVHSRIPVKVSASAQAIAQVNSLDEFGTCFLPDLGEGRHPGVILSLPLPGVATGQGSYGH